MQVNPYLSFEGRCEEALGFYTQALGAQIMGIRRFKESPEPNMCAPESLEKVMHAAFRVGDTMIFASDGRCTGKQQYHGFALSITVPTAAEADRVFSALSDGGKVDLPLHKTFFSESFGMLHDRFGVMWMVMVMP